MHLRRIKAQISKLEESNKMKSTLFIFAVIIATYAVKAEHSCDDDDNNLQICPPMNNFDAEFPSIVDHVLPESEPLFFTNVTNFFRNIVKFNDTQIQQVTNDAINFIKTRYGVDFSTIAPDVNGIRFLASINTSFIPCELNPALGYSISFNRWIVDRTRRSYCVENRDGGFIVIFGSDTVLHGTYGGVVGLPIKANERILYGINYIPLCPQSPLIIHYQSATPTRIDTVDGFATLNFDVYSSELGPGIAQGIFRTTPLGDGTIRYNIRNLYTFPPHPRQNNPTTPMPGDDDDDDDDDSDDK